MPAKLDASFFKHIQHVTNVAQYVEIRGSYKCLRDLFGPAFEAPQHWFAVYLTDAVDGQHSLIVRQHDVLHTIVFVRFGLPRLVD